LVFTDAILNKNNILVVPDLTADFRFLSNPFVAGPPHVKFYAGAPLVSPEGFKLGTICILDLVARPHGLTPDEQNTLVDLADMTVKVMVDRRYQLNKKKSEDPAKMIAYTANDLMAPLTGVHTSLSILKNDAVVKSSLGEQHFELLSTAAACSELMIRICKNALAGVHPSDLTSSTSPLSGSVTAIEKSMNGSSLTNLQEFVKSLQMTADPIPKKVPCIVTLDKSVPSVIVADDLKLFRSSIHLLTNAIDRTSTGMVHLSIRLDETLVLFECEDTGEDIPVDEYQFLFQPGHIASGSRVGLSPVANLMDSMDGEYGFRPRGIDADGNVMTDYKGRRRSGSIFWFSIPLLLPDMVSQTGPARVLSSEVQRSSEPFNFSHGFVAPSLSMPSEYEAHTVTYAPPLASCYVPGVGSSCDDTIANFALAQGTLSESNPNMVDELTKLALELDTSLADLEPLPLNTLFGNNSKDIRRRRALVIDDSIVVRRSLAQALNSLGFDTVQANDGEEGLKEMQRSLFDIVLCDFLMPVMDGVTYVKPVVFRAYVLRTSDLFYGNVAE
jgi:CheY-like chemotaxis protein